MQAAWYSEIPEAFHASPGSFWRRYPPRLLTSAGRTAGARRASARGSRSAQFSDSTHILVLLHCSRECLVNKGVDDPDPVDDNLHIAE